MGKKRGETRAAARKHKRKRERGNGVEVVLIFFDY